MVAKRIIPCLDVKDGQVVKGINFEGLREVGDAVEMGVKYSRDGADELVYLDISATQEGRRTFAALVKRIAQGIDIPFTVGGGIGSIEDEGFIRTLAGVVAGRHAQMPEGSYTTKLFIKCPKAIGKEVVEEAGEAVIEAVDGNRDRFVYEASDLVYHLLVLLESQDVSLSDLERELAFRHR